MHILVLFLNSQYETNNTRSLFYCIFERFVVWWWKTILWVCSVPIVQNFSVLLLLQKLFIVILKPSTKCFISLPSFHCDMTRKICAPCSDSQNGIQTSATAKRFLVLCLLLSSISHKTVFRTFSNRKIYCKSVSYPLYKYLVASSSTHSVATTLCCTVRVLCEMVPTLGSTLRSYIVTGTALAKRHTWSLLNLMRFIYIACRYQNDVISAFLLYNTWGWVLFDFSRPFNVYMSAVLNICSWTKRKYSITSYRNIILLSFLHISCLQLLSILRHLSMIAFVPCSAFSFSIKCNNVLMMIRCFNACFLLSNVSFDILSHTASIRALNHLQFRICTLPSSLVANM